MTLSLLPRSSGREGRDRLEILSALISAPSFDPLLRGDIITVPAGHPVFRWDCLATGCERPASGREDLCAAHAVLWRKHRQAGGARAAFLREAPPLGPGAVAGQLSCRICPGRPALSVGTQLCGFHHGRWQRCCSRNGEGSFSGWLAGQEPLPGYGSCLVGVCPEMADSPLGLCIPHGRRYRRQGSPGGAALPPRWGSCSANRGIPAPVTCSDEGAFRRWCAAEPATLRPDQVNLLGLRPLVRAEIQWGMAWHAAGTPGRQWALTALQRLADFSRALGLSSLTELDPRDSPDKDVARIARLIAGVVGNLYTTPEESREEGWILAGHFGRRLNDSSGRFDLSGISQRWLRDLAWDDMAALLRSPGCPRTGSSLSATRRAGLELSAFLELRAPAGGHDPRLLTAEHMHEFAADHRQRELDGLVSLAARDLHGPGLVTAGTRVAVFRGIRKLLRGTLESGEAGRLGLDRGFVTAMPSQVTATTRARPPFPDEVARALADEANLQRLARDRDPSDRGLRDVWETIIVTGRRSGEILDLHLDCLGRYGGLPLLWHDQSKVGNYDEAVRIPERNYQMLQARQDKTLAVFQGRNNRPPTADERARMALFPSPRRNRYCRWPLSPGWFHSHFKSWVEELDIGRWVPHQARHSLATSLLRAGASLSHVRRFLGHISERMTERYIHLAQTDLEDVLQQVWVAGPGTSSPGELLAGESAPLTRAQAQALAIDLSRRSTPAEGGFCTFQPVVDGGSCPRNLDCGNCDKFVLSGADLLYWRRKREQWRLLAEGAPDDATADYLHAYFEPTARAIDGLEKALAGLGLLSDALALDMRKPQDYFQRVWSTAFLAADLVGASDDDEQDGERQEEPA